MTLPSPTGGFPLLSLLIFGPLIGAAGIACIRNARWARIWSLIVTLGVALASLPLYTQFDLTTAEFQFVEHAPWIPALHIHYTLGIDGISLLLVLLTTWISPLCILASWRYISTRIREFLVCLLVMETAMIGVFCALDFILFFVFWESMLIPMSLMIGVWGGPRRVYASVKFFIYTMSGSVFLLVAIIALFLQTGTFYIPDLMGRPFGPTFQCWIFLAFFLSFAIKVPMIPFHTWLPAAHVEAPTAGSVVLASVLLKMGTYGFLRFSLPITPLATQIFLPTVAWLSVGAIVYGGFVALAQNDLKKLVAYSSVGHMGFVTLGIFALNQPGVEGAILQMINHGVTTGALFIAVGIIYERLHTRDLDQAAGLGKQMPVFAFFLGVFALSSLAFPGTNGFIGEFLVLTGAFAGSKLLVLCLIPGIVAAAAYNLRMLQRVAYGGTRNPDHSRTPDLNLREILTLAPLLILVFWIGLHPQPFTRVLHTSVTHLLAQTAQANPTLPAAHPPADRPKSRRAAASAAEPTSGLPRLSLQPKPPQSMDRSYTRIPER
jgi:NADH-quinone oxidoreductase subunit M